MLSSAAAAVLRSRASSSSSSSPLLKNSNSFSPPILPFPTPPPPAASLVRKGWSPPPAVVGRSCVYVVRRSDGYFYCGESDDLPARLAAHAARLLRGAGGFDAADDSNKTNYSQPRRSIEACYVTVGFGEGGKTAARAIEAAAIRAMRGAGLPLLSDADARHRSWLVEEEGGGGGGRGWEGATPTEPTCSSSTSSSTTSSRAAAA